MKYNFVEKVFQIIAFIVVILGFAMIIWFIAMFVMLSKYDNCKDMNFQPSYCTKYKNF